MKLISGGGRRRKRRRRDRPRSRLDRPLARINVLTALLGVIFSAAAYANGAGPERPEPARAERIDTASNQPDAVDEARRARPPTQTATATPEPRIPERGSHDFRIATGDSARAGDGGEVIRYRVEVEVDLPFEVDEFARDVDRTLSDRRSWTKSGLYSFQRNEVGPLRIILATPQTTDRLCAPLQTRGEVSCRNGNVVAVNALRWSRGARSYGDDIKNYRAYVINHEVGHSLGFQHARCPGPAAKAPVMLQQTLGLDGCEANPWP